MLKKLFILFIVLFLATKNTVYAGNETYSISKKNAFFSEDKNVIEFEKNKFAYSLIKNVIFDLDKLLKELGYRINYCAVSNENTVINYHDFGQCVYNSINYKIKTDKFSLIYVWIKDKDGNLLPPLKMEWKTSQKSWLSFFYEFIYLSAESFFKRFLNSRDNLQMIDEKEACNIESKLSGQKDLGNFIGTLVITAPDGYTLADFLTPQDSEFKHPLLSQKRIARLEVSQPQYMNFKKLYTAHIVLSEMYSVKQGPNDIIIDFNSTYNLITSRRFCFKGTVNNVIPKAKESEALP